VFQKFNGNYIGLIFDCVKKPHITQKDFLPIVRCLLPVAYRLLPIAYCLLPIAYCLLPIAFLPK
jgi:hypothetical protein